MDFLLGRVAEPAGGAVHKWIEEHQVRLQIAFEGARVHNVPPIPDPAISTSVVRRSVRPTAGQHSNVHHLPRPVGEPAQGAVSFPAPALNAVSALYRPWT